MEMENQKNIKIINLIFEGEYLNGKRNGKGKEYNSFGKLSFKGEYKYGLKAKGKEYYPNGKLYFKGGI